MKLGLDIHGVLDKHPELFVELSKAYDEVHIITGIAISKNLIEQLLSYNNGERFWTHLVSIQDELSKTTIPLTYNEKNRPVFIDEPWDSFKGKYCYKHGIDLMIDDTERYGKYFTTKFILFK